MNLQNAVDHRKSQPDTSGFVDTDDIVVTRDIQRVRFSQTIVCHLLVLTEAAVIGLLATVLLCDRDFGVGDIHYAVSGGIAIGAASLLLIFLSGGDTYDRFSSRLTTLGVALAAASLMAAAVLFGDGSSWFIVLSAAVLFVTVLITKILTIFMKNWLSQRGHLTRLVAVAADNPIQRAALVRLLRQRDDIELVFIGSPAQFDILGKLIQANQLDEIVLSGHQANEENIVALTGLAVTLVRVTPQDRLELNPYDPVWGKKQVFSAWSAPAAVVALPPLRGYRGMVKRLIDFAGALTAIILLSPLLLIAAIAIKLESRGPIIFVQERAGYRNKPFRMLKFRSMFAAKTDLTGSQLTTRSDPRVTKIGAILRRTSADELPQLFNVLWGDMSLVGPRPHPKGAQAGNLLYDHLIPNFYSRYRMKPGITGLAQVNGLRGNTETEQHLIDRFSLDLQYAAEWTPILDIVILFRTVAHLCKGTNAF